MDLTAFSRVNLARCTDADGFSHPLEAWSPAEWTNALAGEVGEACNLTKKLLRIDLRLQGTVKPEDRDRATLVAKIGRELADVVIYADLAAQRLGLDLSTLIRETFDAKSAELGAPHRVP
jgi:NTP pyrophosphatase (non-canonical NTP hydrolase)